MKNNYIAALDGIRFLAVTMVLFDHWSGEALGFPASYLGVCLFFVLSGFLITRILLVAKAKDTALGRSHGFSLKQFYMRRTIRIFPVYYLLLAVLFVLNVPPIREHFWWFVTYTTNIYIAYYQTWLGSSDHLWSLAVEEQFYLFFPFVVFFLPLRQLPKLLVGFVFLSVGLRFFFFSAGFSWITPYVLVVTCLDAFGIGGLLAYYYWTENPKVKQLFTGWMPLVISLLFYVVVVVFSEKILMGHNWLNTTFLRLAESLFSVALIGKIIWFQPEKNTLADQLLHRFLSLSWVVYLGKISYGIYIYHNYVYNIYHSSATHPTVRFFNKLAEIAPILANSMPFKLLFLYAIVVVISSISWFFIEKPINKLKDRFGY